MSNLSDIKRRLTTVKQTRQITGAMQTVSVAKMRKADEVCQNAEAYLSLITDIMRKAMPLYDQDDYGFVVPKDGKDVLLVLSSERGLCGGFDNAIFAEAAKETNENTLIMPVCQSAVNYYKKANNADFRFGELGVSHFSLAKSISEYLLKQYGNGVKSISVAYSTVNKQVVCPKVERILPLEKVVENNDGGAETVFEPSPQQVLSALVPLYLSGKLYGAIKNNFAAEQFARHQAMTSATESADELIVTLTSEYNRERQTAVTGQIVEIVGATSALSRKGVGGEKRF